MTWDFIINLSASVIIILGILDTTHRRRSPSRIIRKKFIRTFVIISAIVAFVANIYLSYKDDLYSHFLISKLDTLKLRMEILDKKLIENIKDTTQKQITHIDTLKITKKNGNIAGYVRNIKNKVLPFVRITRLKNNVQTTSHKDGEFIVVSVSEGEILRFKQNNNKHFDYIVKASDFKNIVNIIIKED